MKFQTQSLKPYLSRLQRSLPGKPVSRAAGALWFRPEGSALAIAAFQGDTSYVCRIPAQCSPGDTLGTIDGSRALAVFAKLPDGDADMEINTETGKILLKQDRRRFTLSGIDASWAPEIPGPLSAPDNVDGPALIESIKFAASSTFTDVRMYGPLACVLIKKSPDGLHTVGLNGAQLSMARSRAGWDNLDGQILLPGHYVSLLSACLAKGIWACAILDGSMHMQSADMLQYLTIPLHNDTYPDYQPLIDIQHTTSLAVDKASVLDTLSRLQIFRGTDIHSFSLDVTSQGATAEINSEEGFAQEFLPGSMDGDPVCIRLHLDSFASLLSALPGSGRVHIRMTGPAGLCAVSMEGDDSMIAVTMPVTTIQQEESDVL